MVWVKHQVEGLPSTTTAWRLITIMKSKCGEFIAQTSTAQASTATYDRDTYNYQQEPCTRWMSGIIKPSDYMKNG